MKISLRHKGDIVNVCHSAKSTAVQSDRSAKVMHPDLADAANEPSKKFMKVAVDLRTKSAEDPNMASI
jgi:hypothetical protein